MALQAGFRFYVGKGMFQFKEVGFRVSRTCHLSEYNPNLQQCVRNEVVASLIRGSLQIPNLGLILKVSSLLELIDDFSYFAYRATMFDSGFGEIAKQCWNWSNNKWLPPSFITARLNFSLDSTTDYGQKWIPNTREVTPPRYQLIFEDIFFLNNGRGFVLYSTPLSILTFTLVYAFYWKVPKWRF